MIGMFVIARKSAYTYRSKAVDVRKLGEELGVRYVLQGSVRKLGDTLHVNAQLIATETGAHLWADRFDQKLDDLSAGQEAIVDRIGQTLNVQLADLETARSKQERPTNPDAFDLILRARSLALHPMGPEEHAERKALLEQALRLDPSSIYAMTGLANELDRWQNIGISGQGEHERAAKLVARAATIDPNDPHVLEAEAHLLLKNGRYREAISASQRLLDQYPNSYSAHQIIAFCLNSLGQFREAIPMLETAIRRDPRSPWNYDRYAQLAMAFGLLHRYEKSITWNRRALAAVPPSYTSLRAEYRSPDCLRFGQRREFFRRLIVLSLRQTEFGPLIPHGATLPETGRIACRQGCWRPINSPCALPGSAIMRTRTPISPFPRMEICWTTTPD